MTSRRARGSTSQLQLFDPAPFDEEEDELRYLRTRWPCPACGGMPLPEPHWRHEDERLRPYYGYDPCLGHLPGVMCACCGHGTSEPMLMLLDRTHLRGAVARKKMLELGGSPP